MKNILLLETIHPSAMELLKEARDIRVFEAYSEKSVDEIFLEQTIDVIITRGKGQVTPEVLDACPSLQIIARCGVGLDNIAVEEASKRKIKVVNAPNSNAATIAEHTIALLLMLQRNLYHAISAVKNGDWGWRSVYAGDEINGKTLGILGLGNIGKKVANIAKALGMQVIYWSAHKENVPYDFLSFDEVLRQSDCITLHLPLTSETEHLINGTAFQKMKPNALLINTARGKIIDQAALLKALEEKQIAGFAADVLAMEPPEKNNPLVAHPNSLVTAHLGSLTSTTYRQMCVLTVNNVLGILRGTSYQENCVFNRGMLA
ncbi:hydroxyacid dehydrogenase [Flavobacteriaceae bacterium TP-CH-4]|uniref:Hydroxyacid dehydrogenase n=1 Tax=Pelagihabitans pacificus TaxID=2696054 RepID=A0A967ARB4_9FLAO|nr:hydroxyacid dehydrogenase [Pelagihabitans pacificus]NHF58949.1 hydroxyacid dehydrogenase [Pelagihabitans pacificus]